MNNFVSSASNKYKSKHKNAINIYWLVRIVWVTVTVADHLHPVDVRLVVVNVTDFVNQPHVIKRTRRPLFRVS